MVSYGVREIHIQYRLAGTFPSPEELAPWRAFEARLADEIGEVTDRGAGGGVADVWVWVRDVDIALARIRELLAALGIAERTEATPRSPRLTIQIRCDEELFPSNGELRTNELVQALVDRNVGEYAGTFIEWGSAGVEVNVRDPAVAVEQVKEIVNHLGVSDYTWIASSDDPEQAWRRVGEGDEQTFPVEDRSFSTRIRDGVVVEIHSRSRAPTPAEKLAIEQLVGLAGAHGGRVSYEEINDHMPAEATTTDDIDWFLSALDARGIEVVDEHPT